ncbi:MAG: TIGR03905 family TSCPD domain-containing protein [Bacteroidales bacterium]|nr:TIGR03905 family TSCPD domain-containing protein [Bacteroidales bacterium]
MKLISRRVMDLYYRHFRNRKIYRFVTFATLEATEEEAVVYQAMYGDRRYWIRPRANFFEEVPFDGRMVRRFQPVPKEEALKEITTSVQPIQEMRNVTKLSDTTSDGIRSTSFATCGVTCSTQINLQTEGDIIRRVEIVKGCDGNTKGLARLCEGRRIEDVIGLLEGIDCKGRGTSCPDQLARALKELTSAQ